MPGTKLGTVRGTEAIRASPIMASGPSRAAWGKREISGMSNGDLNWITNFIWGIADDVLSDRSVRGKYRDVILPMTVLRRLDAVLEPTKQAVLDMNPEHAATRLAAE